MNKWVFTCKYNKEEDLTKYKARLIVKGCAQHPSYNYTETFSPVVQLEMIQVILALAVKKTLDIQQMDIKGAYLNSTLKEEVFMWQPEGYTDNSDWVCRLIKTLYSLKQSGCEWNIELDTKLKKHDFDHLKSDPCTYVKRCKQNLAIITVWVDDLLLFTTTRELMNGMKNNIKAEWETTDLGEPTKIVGIEITQGDGIITISQKRYIESILKKQGLENANPVSMPMDPNVKLEPNPDGNEGDQSNAYAKLLGELQFLANATRPDIA